MGQGPRGTRRSPGCGLQRLLWLLLLLSLARGASGEPGTDGECGTPGARDASQVWRLRVGAWKDHGGGAARSTPGCPLGTVGCVVEAALLRLTSPGVGGVRWGLDSGGGLGGRRAAWREGKRVVLKLPVAVAFAGQIFDL